MRTALSLTVAAALAGFVTTPAVIHADESVVEHHSEYNSERTIEQEQPSVRERTTVETVPADPVVQKRTSETVVKKGKDHDSDTKIESKTKIKHDED